MIETHEVTRRYGSATVVDGVSLAIPRSGVTTIIGPNGAGKSTLLSMISRLVRVDSGRVLVDGLDVHRTSGDVLARRLAILRQENHLSARLSVEDLVAFGRYPYSKGRPTIEDKRHIDAALAYMGLEDLRHRFTDELSGGQRQRAHVAMVLCQDTDYVLLDEPLNSLDMKHAVSMMRQIRKAAIDLGKTVVLVLHDINFASCYSDHIIAMRDGRVVHQGTPSEMMQREVLRDIYDVDVHVETVRGHQIGVYFA